MSTMIPRTPAFFQRRLDGNRPNEVSSDQNLQTHQDPPAEHCTTAPVGCFAGGPLKEIADDGEQGKCESEDKDNDRDPLEGPGDVLHRVHGGECGKPVGGSGTADPALLAPE